jgi:hypothetical protein
MEASKKVRKTTKGLHLCVEWKDGTTIWERLADLKERNPVEVAEYAVAKNLLDAPAFVWWAPHVLKKIIISIAAVEKWYHKLTHKFGIETPHAITYASVVSRESVKISSTLASLNDLDVKMADIENAYMKSLIADKVWTVLGP